jgi:hypothetical protein
LTWLIPPLGLEDIISSALVMEEQFVGGYVVDGGCGWWLVGRFTMSWTMSRTKVRPFLASSSTLRSISALASSCHFNPHTLAMPEPQNMPKHLRTSQYVTIIYNIQCSETK